VTPPRRRGTSLVEVVLGLGLSTLVLGIALAIWTTTVRLGSKTDGVADDVTRAAALYSALAADVHRAQASTVAVSPDGLELTFDRSDAADGGPVRYRLEPGQVRREADQEPDRLYPLSASSDWDLQLVRTSSATMPGYLLVTIVVGGDDPGRGLVFEAATPLAEEGGDFPEWNHLP
jgi:hypothetical protein